MSTQALAEALFPRTRLAVLRELCRPGDPELHVREIARRTGFDSRGIMRELRRLEQVGILKSRRAGRQLMYAMNPSCTVYPELTMLVAKTVGIAHVVREELLPLADGIEMAYIYGSVASGEAQAESDVDVMVVGEVSLRELARPLRRAGERLAREVNVTAYSPQAYHDELATRDSFVLRAHNGPRIPILGAHDDAR